MSTPPRSVLFDLVDRAIMLRSHQLDTLKEQARKEPMPGQVYSALIGTLNMDIEFLFWLKAIIAEYPAPEPHRRQCRHESP